MTVTTNQRCYLQIWVIIEVIMEIAMEVLAEVASKECVGVVNTC